MEGLDSSSLYLNGDECGVESFTRTDLYEERSTPYSGIGAFATTLIPSGTRIFCEDPLFILPDAGHAIQLYKAVKSLPEKKQAAFWALAATSKPSRDNSLIESLRKYYRGKKS
jgi:hypothetical protein